MQGCQSPAPEQGYLPPLQQAPLRRGPGTKGEGEQRVPLPSRQHCSPAWGNGEDSILKEILKRMAVFFFPVPEQGQHLSLYDFKSRCLQPSPWELPPHAPAAWTQLKAKAGTAVRPGGCVEHSKATAHQVNNMAVSYY